MDGIRAMVLLPPGLQSLIDLLREHGWTVIGPTVRDGVVEDAEVTSVDQLPGGVHEMRIHLTILARDVVTDPADVTRRENTFIIALTCSDPAGTCFCASTGTGPVPDEGFDLALTELLDDGWHRFLVVAGSDRGEDLLDELKAGAVGDEVLNAARADFDAAHEVGIAAARRMGRSLDTDGLPDLP